MMDTNHLIEVVPHYFALIASVFTILIVIRATIGDLGFWVELLIILVISLSYQPIVRFLGVAPSSWEKN